MKIGRFEIFSFVEQHFRLDGGSMFGVIPKSMWSKLIEPDENNLISMVTNLFVLKAHGKNMIFDIGLGDTLNERERKVYGTDGVSALEQGLSSLGLTPNDMDYVILTHLHTDHAGGAVKLVDDRYVPRFRNARYIINRKEWQVAMEPDERTAAVYVPQRLQPLKEADQVEFIDGTIELFPGIKAVHTGGHTEAHYALQIESEGEKVFYYADIFCTSHHLRLAFVPATDLLPLETMEVKRRALASIVDTGVIMAFDHDVVSPFARVTYDGKRLVAQPVSESVVKS
jgi:glyoxylase-like metal-dependent hydrolase (beta-lactamase superfamily II)